MAGQSPRFVSWDTRTISSGIQIANTVTFRGWRIPDRVLIDRVEILIVPSVICEGLIRVGIGDVEPNSAAEFENVRRHFVGSTENTLGPIPNDFVVPLAGATVVVDCDYYVDRLSLLVVQARFGQAASFCATLYARTKKSQR